MIRELPLKLTFAVLGFFISLSTISAQVSLREISLKEQIDNSSLVVEGKVIATQSFWDAEHRLIYTANTVEVYKVFKGDKVETIEIITQGGFVGLDGMLASHSLKLGKGSLGTFTLHESKVNLSSKNKTKTKQFKVYSGVQGFYSYDINNDVAVNPFSKRKGITSSLYNDILRITKGDYNKVKPFDIESLQKISIHKNRSSAPSGITFSPTTIKAGAGSVLTIEGSGFGATQGKVSFRDSDTAGFPFFDALDSQVLSWADDLITVEVPVISTDDASMAGTAGTGAIRVTDIGGDSNISNAVLTISSAQFNVPFDPGTGTQAYPTQHFDDNGTGGYTWIMENDFFNEITHADAPAAFLRAFDSWRCETKVNWEVSGSSTSTSVVSTEENIIAFDEDGTISELPAGVLGTCFYTLKGSNCASGIVVFVSDLDIIFDKETSWYFGTGDITGKFDFETVVLHELGHGHQLGHVINTSNVMHYSLGDETIKTVLDINSVSAANDVQSRSTFSQSLCTPTIINPMTDYTGSCGLNVEEFTLENSISLYPNPTKQEFFIKSSIVNLDKIEIFDVSGRLISKIDISDASRTIPVNLRGASKGLYFVNIYSDSNYITKKLVVE